MNKALFLDRDGVINKDKGYVHRIEDFEFTDGLFEVLEAFQRCAYLLIIITNQAGIGRGIYTENDFQSINYWMLQQFKIRGIEITKVYFDPTHPENGIGKYKKESFYRKPNPGMILQAQKEFKIDLENSILIGDKESDILAGKRANIGKTVLLKNTNFSQTGADVVIGQIIDLINLIN